MAENTNNFIINKKYDALLFRTILKRFWWWIPLFMLVFYSFAVVYLRYTKPKYEAQLVLQLESEDNAKSVIDIDNINTKKDLFYSDVELLKSELLFTNALKRLEMHTSIFYKGKFLTEEKYKIANIQIFPYQLTDSTLINVPIRVDYNNDMIELSYYHDGKLNTFKEKLGEHIITPHFDVIIKSEVPEVLKNDTESNEVYFVFNNGTTIKNRFYEGLTVMPLDERARTVLLSFKGDNSKICYDITLGLAHAFIDYSVKLKKKGSENILNFIDSQLDSLSLELKRSKDSLMNFQRSVNLADPESTGTDLQSEANKFQEELFSIDDETATLRSINKRLQENPGRLDIYKILPELLGKSYESALSNHIEALHTLFEEKDELLFKVTPESAEAKRLDKKINEKTKQISRSISTIEERLRGRRLVIKAKLGELEGEYAKLPEKRMEYNRLKNIQDLNEKYFQLLTEKKVQFSISDAGFSSNNRILQMPVNEGSPVEPNGKVIMMSFLFFGLFLGIGMLFLKYVSFNEINLIQDLESILPPQATVLGGVPLTKAEMSHSQVVVTQSPKSVMAEAMRKIRVNLSYINPDYKTIAITSSISGEGKTFVALNLSAIIAMTGKKTILLDLDMRKPKVNLAFKLPNDKGMSNLIIGKISLDEAIVENVETNLDVITSGPIPPNPSELLLNKSFTEIIKELKARYDIIVIDNPPVGLVSDGVKILTEADIPIYVFKSQYSKRNFAFRIKEFFEMKQLTKLNVILNGIEATRSNQYGYGYGYYDEYSRGETTVQSKVLSKTKKLINRIFKKKWK